MKRETTIILADDHSIVREGLKLLLATIDGTSVVAEAADCRSLADIVRSVKADILLLDLGMPGFPGFQFIEELRGKRPGLRILILSANIEPRSVRAALAAGAAGYLTKHGDPSELADAVEAVRQGKTYIAEAVRFAVEGAGTSNNVPEPTGNVASTVQLTRREQQILALIPHGASAREIAERLGISPLTVRKHRENLMRKLDLHSGAELTAYAVRIGLTTA